MAWRFYAIDATSPGVDGVTFKVVLKRRVADVERRQARELVQLVRPLGQLIPRDVQVRECCEHAGSHGPDSSLL